MKNPQPHSSSLPKSASAPRILNPHNIISRSLSAYCASATGRRPPELPAAVAATGAVSCGRRDFLRRDCGQRPLLYFPEASLMNERGARAHGEGRDRDPPLPMHRAAMHRCYCNFSPTLRRAPLRFVFSPLRTTIPTTA